MHCHSCGKEIIDNIDICLFCGSNLQSLDFIYSETDPEDLGESQNQSENDNDIKIVMTDQDYKDGNIGVIEEEREELEVTEGLEQGTEHEDQKDGSEVALPLEDGDSPREIEGASQEKEQGPNLWDKFKTRITEYVNVMKNIKAIERIKSINYFNNVRDFIGRHKSPRLYSLITVMALLIILSAVYAGHRISTVKKIEKITALVELGQIKEAKEIYDTMSSHSMLEKIDYKLIKRIDDTGNDYINEKIEYQQIDKLLTELYQFSRLEQSINSWREVADKYNASRQSMKEALELMKNKNYIEAIEKFKNVIAEDERYSLAQDNINLCINEMYQDYKRREQELYNQGQFAQLYKIVKTLLLYKPQDQELKNKPEIYLSKIYEDGVLRAEQQAQEHQYNSAIANIKEIMEYFPEDQKLIDQLEKYIIQKEEYLAHQMSTKTTIDFDKNLNALVAVPKGYITQHINVNTQINVYPMLAIGEQTNNAALCIIAGFEQANLINFNEINFELDNNQIIKWPISSDYKHTKSFYDGTIAEWAVISRLNREDLLNEIIEIINSSNVTIVFKGEGTRNHIMTQREKNNLKLFIELLQYYQ